MSVVMANDDFLKLNPKKLIRCLENILPASELQKIDDELRRNVKQLIRLGEEHLRYSRTVSGRNSWRQRVSRAYYACYSTSKALRLAKNGMFSTDSKDHQKIGGLPDDFPEKDIWCDMLTKFRADRNIADYDHSAKERNLEYPSSQYLDEATAFLRVIKAYMKRNSLV